MTLALGLLGFTAPTLAVVVTFLLTRRKVQEVHVAVNGRLTILLARIEQLEGAIRTNGHEVPPAPPVLAPELEAAQEELAPDAPSDH